MLVGLERPGFHTDAESVRWKPRMGVGDECWKNERM